MRKYLFSQGFRYRVNVASLPGKPDIVLKKYKTVIFVNGCFWHGHKNCKYFSFPKTKIDYWNNKITLTIKRDKKKKYELGKLDYKVIVIWECELKNKTQKKLKKVISLIKMNEIKNV